MLDTSAGSPTGSGTPTSATSQTFTSLTQGTVYYLHVRSGCRCTNRSAWTTVSFTTICDTISHLTVYGILDTGAYIRWDSIRGVSAYEYVVDTFAASPTGSGTAVTDSSVLVLRLQPGRVYFAHVRHACSGGYSAWQTVAFSTSRCDTISSITAFPGDTVVRVAWTAVTGASTYYYVINTSPLDPGGIGIPTTATSVIQGALTTSTNYYVHIRTGCTGGLARWQTVPFRTLSCDTVYTISVTDICDTSANLSWTYGATGSGFLYVVDNSAASPTVRGNYSSVPSASLNNLAPGTTYYVHVRKLCGTTDTSAWVTSAAFSTPPCDPVTGLSASSITTTTAVVNWTLVSCIAGYEYVVDFSSAAPSGSGIFSGLNYLNLSALTPGSNYYIHVRVICGGGYYSAWTTIPFLTLCEPTVITINSISDNSATVNWISVPGAIGYEQAVDNSPTPPATGSAVTGTSFLAAGLSPNTAYYAHVRVQCAGNFSAWADTPFTTFPVGVQTVNGQQHEVAVYPNPASEQVTVATNTLPANGALVLTDITGKILWKGSITTLNTAVDLSYLEAGAYLLRFTDGPVSQVFKLTKQ
ncbi:MAG: T9SS C-terminal target domain-containing protein [Chitinophagia bacterium]|nr:T9SS C-terminal target domain-containing protein [Chitinophagia bacterium]